MNDIQIDENIVPFSNVDLPDPDYISPPLVFEEKTGITGIHTPWRMPFGLSHREAEKIYRDTTDTLFRSYKQGKGLGDRGQNADQLLSTMITGVARLNPQLEKLFVDYDGREWEILHGAISQINAKDIEYFLFVRCLIDYYHPKTHDEELRKAPLIVREHEATAEIEKKLGVRFGWRVSPPTLEKVRDKIGINLLAA